MIKTFLCKQFSWANTKTSKINVVPINPVSDKSCKYVLWVVIAPEIFV